MIFRTEILPPQSGMRIGYDTPVMFMGSCFSDNIGNMLKESGFPVNINPFGVLYNPASVVKSLKNIIRKKEYSVSGLFEYNNEWHSWDHHSSFSGQDKETTVQKINRAISEAHTFLKSASYLVITLGTARIYRLKKTGSLVCNCHKVPADDFDRELLGVSEILNDFHSLGQELRAFNPSLRIIYTVSPVRHWKDGAHGNQVSKSILHLAIYNLLKVDKCGCEYFPSYELLLDDLRDYRYFADDLLHPNKLAIQYIWEKFRDVYMDKKTISLSGEISKLNKASEHRLNNPDSPQSQKFLRAQLSKIESLKKLNPHLNLESLEESFRKKLHKSEKQT